MVELASATTAKSRWEINVHSSSLHGSLILWSRIITVLINSGEVKRRISADIAPRDLTASLKLSLKMKLRHIEWLVKIYGDKQMNRKGSLWFKLKSGITDDLKMEAFSRKWPLKAIIFNFWCFQIDSIDMKTCNLLQKTKMDYASVHSLSWMLVAKSGKIVCLLLSDKW